MFIIEIVGGGLNQIVLTDCKDDEVDFSFIERKLIVPKNKDLLFNKTNAKTNVIIGQTSTNGIKPEKKPNIEDA